MRGRCYSCGARSPTYPGQRKTDLCESCSRRHGKRVRAGMRHAANIGRPSAGLPLGRVVGGFIVGTDEALRALICATPTLRAAHQKMVRDALDSPVWRDDLCVSLSWSTFWRRAREVIQKNRTAGRRRPKGAA